MIQKIPTDCYQCVAGPDRLKVVVHQWSELVFVFTYYGTAGRRLEVAA